MGTLFLDSAVQTEVEAAAASGVVSGVTTNPTILSNAAKGGSLIAHALSLFELFPEGRIFYQVHAGDEIAAAAQVRELVAGLGGDSRRLVFKLPAQPEWFAFGARLTRQGHRVAFTAVYHPGQLLAAAQAGAEYVIPYVDRARKLRPDAPEVVAQLSAFETSESPRVLAASIKTADQALRAFQDGAHAITASWDVLHSLMTDELTDSAVEQFHGVVPL